MANSRTGLHKNISAIFDGVPLPSDDSRPFIPDNTKPSYIGYVPAAPSAEPTCTHITETPQQSSKTSSPSGRLKKLLHYIKNKLAEPRPDINPKKQKTVIVLLPILLLVFVFTLIQTSCSSSAGRANLKTKAGSLKAASVSETKIEWSMPEPYPDTLRDPTRPTSTSVTDSGARELIVNGIVHGQENSIAVISNRMVKQGDEILGATVVKINKDNVVFEMESKTWTQKVQRTLSRR